MNKTFKILTEKYFTAIDEGKIASAFTGDLQQGIDSLVELTYKNGAPDNVTIIAARIGEEAMSVPVTKFGAAS